MHIKVHLIEHCFISYNVEEVINSTKICESYNFLNKDNIEHDNVITKLRNTNWNEVFLLIVTLHQELIRGLILSKLIKKTDDINFKN